MAKKYSSKERKAYHMGRAYGTAKLGKRVKCPDEATKQSFRNGVNAVKDKKSEQATCANCGSPLYVVDGNGIVVKVLNGGKEQ